MGCSRVPFDPEPGMEDTNEISWGMSRCSLIGWMLCILLLGCGGLTREYVYRPVAPVDSETGVPYGREGDFDWWDLELDAGEIMLLPVRISGKTTWVFGPFIAFPVFLFEEEVPNQGALAIRVIVRVPPGDVIRFDTRQFTVELEDGRSLLPTRTVWGARTEDARAEPAGLVRLSGVNWSRDLEYDVLVSDLSPFALRLGPLTVNGKTTHPPLIRFVRDKRYRGN
jgi:hypothetical protein